MNCLCCGKPLKEGNATGWHSSCIRRFFGSDSLPSIELSDSALKQLAIENAEMGFVVPGVQKKLSLHWISSSKKPRLTLVGYPTGYILKPQVDDYRCLPEAEHLVMSMADATGISTVPHALIQNEGKLAYITRRVDRVESNGSTEALAMEDFCQLGLRLSEDKYKGSYERCGKIIERYSNQPGLDRAEFFFRLLFCFVTGNSDMHLKNFSLIEASPGSSLYYLSPAYDLLPVLLLLKGDTEELALTLNGKKTHLLKKDFVQFGIHGGLPKTAIHKMMSKIVSMKPKYLQQIEESLLPLDLKQDFEKLLEERIQRLSQ